MVVRLRLFSKELSLPVRCDIEFWRQVPGTSRLRCTNSVRCEGEYVDIHGEDIYLLKVIPFDGHWTKILYFKDLEFSSKKSSDPLLIEFVLFSGVWWKSVLGVDNPSRCSAKGIGIGVIDSIFVPDNSLKHFNFVDPKNDIARAVSLLNEPEAGHGQRVSTAIGRRHVDGVLGVAHDADFYFMDATNVDDCEDDIGIYVDVDRVADAIDVLSRIHRVNIINISLGFDKQSKIIDKSIDSAVKNGTLCVCAAGNSALKPIAWPAAHPAAVAVGGIGVHLAGPSMCFMDALYHEATRKGLSGAEVYPFGSVFADINCSFGPELNAAAPSMAVMLTPSDDIFCEYSGTSFASPLVTGVLACALAADFEYAGLSGWERVNHARGLLKSMCRTYGLPSARVGWGMPTLATGLAIS